MKINNEMKIAIFFLCIGVILGNVIGICDYHQGWLDSKQNEQNLRNQTPCKIMNITQDMLIDYSENSEKNGKIDKEK